MEIIKFSPICVMGCEAHIYLYLLHKLLIINQRYKFLQQIFDVLGICDGRCH